MPYLQPNQTWIPEVLEWAPNRMPAAWINLRPGGSMYCTLSGGNYRGLQDWWYDQDDDPTYDGAGTLVFASLESKLTEAYNHGFRRIILNLPAGMVFDHNMASAQWWSMPAWKRAGLACLIENWLASKPDTQFEIYGAFQNNDHASLCVEPNIYSVPSIDLYHKCPTTSGPNAGMFYPCFGANWAYTPSVLVPSHMCEFHMNIHPWMHLGITRYWLDWSNHLWPAYEEFPYSPLYAPGQGQHHFLGAEAIPIVSVGNGYEIDLSKAVLSPAMAFLNYFRDNDEHRTWDVAEHAHATEIMAVLDHTAQYFQVDHMFGVLAWTQRGFVLASQGVESIGTPAVPATRLIEYMKRVYDFGPLANANDFNGDGLVNQQDVDDFTLMYNLYFGHTNVNWVHGDVNGDNTITLADLLVFNTRRMMQTMTGNPVPLHLGTADPYDALTRP